MRALEIQQYGGPEVMELQEVPEPEPGPGEVLIRVQVSSVNSHDVFLREGLFGAAFPFPVRMGLEVAVMIEALGEGVDGDLDVPRFSPLGLMSTVKAVMGVSLILEPGAFRAVDRRALRAPRERGHQAAHRRAIQVEGGRPGPPLHPGPQEQRKSPDHGVTVIDRTTAERWAVSSESCGDTAVAGCVGDIGSVADATVSTLELAGVKLSNVNVKIMDLAQINSGLEGGGSHRIDGIIGSDLMISRGAVIEYGTRRLHLRNTES